MNSMSFYFIHLMPWPYLPADFDTAYDSTWVTLPNTIYDPVKGHELYNRYFDQLEYADRLGWDGVVVNEHHQNAYGTMPSPNIMAAVLSQRIKRAKICPEPRTHERGARSDYPGLDASRTLCL
jgi:hypothetical protein